MVASANVVREGLPMPKGADASMRSLSHFDNVESPASEFLRFDINTQPIASSPLEVKV